MRTEHIAVVTPNTTNRDYGLNPIFKSICGCGGVTGHEGGMHAVPGLLVEGKPVQCWLPFSR